MIRIHDLQYYYQNKQALFDINLSLEPNTITGLIGPNGAGKSTLMRCIAGLEQPQHGEILFDGQPIFANLRANYPKIGYLPDIFGLSEQLTVLQSWSYAAKSRGVSDQDLPSRLLETAQLLHLEEQLSDPIKQLSRGQKQRVGIGQVIIHHPQLLILDEPASGLDPEARYELSVLFNQLKHKNMTLLVSSHILSELDEYCTHMLVIKEGHIKQHKRLESHDIYATQSADHKQEIAIVLRFISLSEAEQQLVAAAPHVSNLSFGSQQVTLSIAAKPEYRAELIRYLIEHNLSLIAVEPLKESLLKSYRDSLAEELNHG